MTEKVVLAYSGGLDTSVAIKWIKDKYGYDVIAVTIDVGNEKDFTAVREKALKVGAAKALVIDAKKTFVEDYIFPVLKAGSLYEGVYPMATSIARPLMAKLLAEVAEGAAAIAHGCTGKGNDQVRFEVAINALAPAVKIIAPAREWGMTREDTIRYASKFGIPVPVKTGHAYSTDENLWGRSVECGVLEDPWAEPPEEVYAWTKSASTSPAKPEYCEIEFDKGIPVACDGVPMDGVSLISKLNDLAGKHGVGRIDHVENRLVGIKSREIYEAPAAVLLLTAHQSLEDMTLAKDQSRFKAKVAAEFADLIYNGLWFTANRQDLAAYVDSTQRFVSGTVRLKLFRGSCTVVGRKSASSLYSHGLATYEKGDQFDQSAAPGFIQIFGLPVKTQARIQPLFTWLRIRNPKPKENSLSHIRGRFQKDAAEAVVKYTTSLPFDRRMYRQDTRGSIAHARMLAKQGIITADEAMVLEAGLKAVTRELDEGRFIFKPELEDIHMAIEARLLEIAGPVAGKLHTARSRNDQVALDMRLYARDAITATMSGIRAFQLALVDQAEKNAAILMPGYTHMQLAQPVLLAHHLMAYFEMLHRDYERFGDCFKRTDVMPLGSGALAGAAYDLDREFVAKELGFSGITQNSLDAVSDRDFVIEYMGAASICMMHISRLAEELVIWSSGEFGFVEMDDSYATASSIMPQKKNPDVAELGRGKTGRVFGHLSGMLTTMKGLPLSYNRDLQEDKEGLFDTVDTLVASLEVFAGMVSTLEFKSQNMRRSLDKGFILATDVADYLVKKGLSFREAHGVTGRLVNYAIGKGKTLESLSLGEYRDFSPLFADDIRLITAETSIASKNVPGGTAPGEVSKQIIRCKKMLG